MATNTANSVTRDAHLKWVPIPEMRVNALAQRDLNASWVNQLAVEMDLDKLGNPTLNFRDGHYYVVDGMHRVEALKVFGFADYRIQCWVYEGLTEQEEAEQFLVLNHKLTVDTFASFRVAVQAGREVEVDIDRIVNAVDLRISRDTSRPGTVRAVGMLRRIYRRAGAKTLQRTLTVARDAFGDTGMESVVLDGLALVVGRYEDRIDDEVLVTRLSKLNGGAPALSAKAEVMRQRTAKSKTHCVAAVVVEAYNAGRGGPRVTPWWRSESDAA